MGRAGRWLSTTEAKDRLGITLRTLYRLIDEGRLPAYKIGRVIRVKDEDVDAFLEASRIQPGTLEHLYPNPPVRDGSPEDHEAADGPQGDVHGAAAVERDAE